MYSVIPSRTCSVPQTVVSCGGRSSVYFVAPTAISGGLPSHYPLSYGGTNRIVERGVQAIHALNGKDRQIHQEAGPNEPCSSQSVVMGSNVLRRSNSNGGNIVSGDTAMAAPAGFSMIGLQESKICSTGPRAQIFRLGDPGKSAPGGNAVGRRGTLNLGAGRAESSQHQSAPDMGSRERCISWYAGVSTNRPSTEVTTAAGTVTPVQGDIKRQALRIGGGRSVEVAPSHRGVHGFPIGYEPYGRRVGDMAPLQKPSLNRKAALRDRVEQRVCDDATASTAAITTDEKTKRARTSEGGFRELERMIRLCGIPRFTSAGPPGQGQYN